MPNLSLLLESFLKQVTNANIIRSWNVQENQGEVRVELIFTPAKLQTTKKPKPKSPSTKRHEKERLELFLQKKRTPPSSYKEKPITPDGNVTSQFPLGVKLSSNQNLENEKPTDSPQVVYLNACFDPPLEELPGVESDAKSPLSENLSIPTMTTLPAILKNPQPPDLTLKEANLLKSIHPRPKSICIINPHPIRI